MFFDQNTNVRPLKHRQLLNLLVAGEIDLKAHLARQPRPMALLAVSPVNCRVRTAQLSTVDELHRGPLVGLFIWVCALTATLLLPPGIGAQSDPNIDPKRICPRVTPCVFIASDAIRQGVTRDVQESSSISTSNFLSSTPFACAAESSSHSTYRRLVLISKTLSTFTRSELGSPKICQMAPVVGSAADWKLFDFETERQKLLSNTRVPVDRAYIPNSCLWFR